MSRSDPARVAANPWSRPGSVWQCSSNKNVRMMPVPGSSARVAATKIFAEKFGKKLTDSMVRRTLEGQTSGRCPAWKSKAGKTFDARLVPDRQYGIGLSFDDLNRKRK